MNSAVRRSKRRMPLTLGGTALAAGEDDGVL
jgi:hypothetical protein